MSEPSFKGNEGNLLQHWVLCELLGRSVGHAERLQFIDAHAMAPVAARRTQPSQKHFDSVQEGLPGQRSPYENTWHSFALAKDTYLNSAMFVRAIWPGPAQLLLCENDSATVQALRQWDSANNIGAEIRSGDWRRSLLRGVPDAELTLLSFDPNYVSWHRGVKQRNAGAMYPEDLEKVAAIARDFKGSLLVQISTYTAWNNSQCCVEPLIKTRLKAGGLVHLATARPNKQMMSLVFARDVSWASEFGRLGVEFTDWQAGWGRRPKY